MRHVHEASPGSGPGVPAPVRNPAQRRLAIGLTLQALLGLGTLSGCVVGLLACALWVAFSGSGQYFILHIIAGLATLMAAGYLLTWLWQPPSEISGVLVVREDSPELFKSLDRMCAIYRVKPVDRIMIGADMNAAIVHLPELGLWGRLRTTLVIGLPLLHSLDPQQFRAIIAHELSHLAYQRRPMAAWAAQWRAWWHRVLIAVQDDETLVGWAVASLLSRHADSYLLQSVRLSHLEEFEADAGAAALVGAEAFGAALIELAMKERYLREEYWDAVMSQFEFPEVGRGILPFGTMGIGVSLGFQRSEQSGRMGELLELDPGLDLHPSLTERLDALRVAPHSPVRNGHTAAETYLGPVASGLACRLDRAWCMALSPCCK